MMEMGWFRVCGYNFHERKNIGKCEECRGIDELELKVGGWEVFIDGKWGSWDL